MAENQTTAVTQVTKKQEVILAFNKVVNGGYIQNQLTNIMGKNAGSFTSSMIELFSQDSGLQECDPKAVVMEAMKAAGNLPLRQWCAAFNGTFTDLFSVRGLDAVYGLYVDAGSIFPNRFGTTLGIKYTLGRK